MPPAHQSLRKKKNLFHAGSLEALVHGHSLEYFMKVTNVLVSVGFIVGAVCFFHEDLTAAGAWIFVIGSAIGLLFSIHDIIEERHTFAIVMRHPTDHPIENREKSNELFEALCFAVSGCLFCAGSVLYIPSIGESLGKTGQAWGSWIFISGSAGYIFASFFNANGMAAKPDETKVEAIYLTCHRIHVVNLLCQQWGSVLFFTGSFLYRPGLADHCADQFDPQCVDTTNVGTWLYVVGASLFLVDALGSLLSTALRQWWTDQEKNEQRACLAEGAQVGV